MIQGVEHLPTELKMVFLPYHKILVQGQIDSHRPWSIQYVAAGVAEVIGTGWDRRKSGDVVAMVGGGIRDRSFCDAIGASGFAEVHVHVVPLLRERDGLACDPPA